MRSSILLSVFALGVLAEPVARGLKPADSASCWTRSSCTPGPKTLSTTYSTTVQLTTLTTTVTTASTAIPSARTTTITGTTTVTVTAPTSTKVATSTQTSTSTVLVTSTSALTATTTTTVTSTTNAVIPIATPFVPVRDQIPGSSYQTAAAAKRDADKRSPAGAAPKSYYAAGVNCIVYSKSTVRTTKTVTSIATASASTVSSSTVITVTSTVYPSATSTVTAQTTVYTTSTQTTSTTVATSTITSTIYQAASASPIVAACDLNRNFINSVGNENIIQIYEETRGLTYITSNQKSAYDCCVYAYNNPNGNPSTFVYFPSPPGKVNCVATSTDTCTTGQLSSVEGFRTSASYPVKDSQVIGQFQCGRWHYQDAAFIASQQTSDDF